MNLVLVSTPHSCPPTATTYYNFGAGISNDVNAFVSDHLFGKKEREERATRQLKARIDAAKHEKQLDRTRLIGTSWDSAGQTFVTDPWG